MTTSTTFFVIELGTSPMIDTVEGNRTAENHAALNGLRLGSASDPLAARVAQLSPDPVNGPGRDGSAGSYQADNNVADEAFRINGGPPRIFDAILPYANSVITYTDGTTATLTLPIMQDTDGRLYLVPPATGPNAITAALEAKPIQSITLGTAQPANGSDVFNMAAERFVMTLHDNTVDGTSGGDRIDAGYSDAKGDGVDGRDNFSGTNDDTIRAYGGDDTVEAGAGQDLVFGGDGNDIIRGGGGQDTLHGDAGDDTIHGGGANAPDAVLVAFESFEGGAEGWSDNRTESGGGFGQFLGRFGGTGETSGSGGAPVQKTFALAPGHSAAVIEFDLYIIDSWDGPGGSSWTNADGDVFRIRINGQQIAAEPFQQGTALDNARTSTATIGGVTYTVSFVPVTPSRDIGFSGWTDEVWRVRIEAQGYTADHITLGFAATTDEARTNESFGIDNLSVVSTNNPAVQVGQVDGNDLIFGGAGHDLAFGGSGNDTIFGGSGNDTLHGDAGHDRLEGEGGDDLIYGGAGNDTLVGGAGRDTLHGGEGDDSLDGGAGNDTLQGGAGDDMLSGGDGSDTAVFSGPVTDYSFARGPDGELIVSDSIAGRDGTDTLTGVEYLTFDGVTYRLVQGDNGSNTTLQGPPGEPALIIAHDGNDWGGGHATSDAIFGGAGDDTLDGGDGDDTLSGDQGDDLLRGDGGNDRLFGGAGRDTLQGGAGDDMLSGGAGSDTFVLTTGGGSDRITDFDLTRTDGRTADQLDVTDLRNAQGGKITARDVTVSDDGKGNAVLTFPEGESVVLEGIAPADVQGKRNMNAMGIPCFTPGTRIATPRGEVMVEHLRPGDLVLTHDGGAVPLRWVGRRSLGPAELAADPGLAPVILRRRAFGNRRRMVVSPQHGLLWCTEGREVLIRAGHAAEVLGWQVARVDRRGEAVTYIHLLLDSHRLLIAEGVPAESFYPGPVALAGLDTATLAALLTLIPGLARVLWGAAPVAAVYGPPVRPYLRRRDLVMALSTRAARAVRPAPPCDWHSAPPTSGRTRACDAALRAPPGINPVLKARRFA